jgi:hypothetical protein
MLIRRMSAAVALLLAAFSACAADAQTKQMEVDEDHVTSWNRFAGNIYDLHIRQIAGRAIHQTQVVGLYNGTAASGYGYQETSYYDAGTGLLLSRVRVDRDRPKIVHIIEVFIYDQQGRVARDFAAIYLPWAQNAPMRTLINVHQFNRELHAYRQFDASGERVYEQCKGMHAGEKVDISLEQQEINARSTASAAYQACFAGVQQIAGIYRSRPQ